MPLAELRDVLAAMAGADVVQRHPLQPFDPRNFDPVGPRSFDHAALGGARAAQQPSVPAPAFLPEPLPPIEPGDVDLAELISFLENPIQGFLRQRLGFRVPDLDEDVADTLDLELDPLARWGIGERMLGARLAGADPAAFRAAEWRRGTLPPADSVTPRSRTSSGRWARWPARRRRCTPERPRPSTSTWTSAADAWSAPSTECTAR